MFIYRLEHKEYKYGPYSACDSDIRKLKPTEEAKQHARELIRTHSIAHERYPGVIVCGCYARVACRTLPALLRWFEDGDWIEKFAKEGFGIAKYKISKENVLASKRCRSVYSSKPLSYRGQVVFDSSKAELIGYIEV